MINFNLSNRVAIVTGGAQGFGLAISERFKFMTAKIEFCIGLAQYKDDILITFGFQDNCSYLIKINKDKLNNLIYKIK